MKTDSGDKMNLISRYSELMILDKIHKLAVNLAENRLDPMLVLSESALRLGDNSIMEHMNYLYEADVSGRGINLNYGKGFIDRDFSPRMSPTPPPLPKPKAVTPPADPLKPEEELKQIVALLLKNGMSDKQVTDLVSKAIEVTKPRVPVAADFEDMPGFDGSDYEKSSYKDNWWYRDMTADVKKWFDNLTPEKQKDYADEMTYKKSDSKKRSYEDKAWYKDMHPDDQAWFDKQPEEYRKKAEDDNKALESVFAQEIMNEWVFDSWGYLAGIDFKKNKKRNR